MMLASLLRRAAALRSGLSPARPEPRGRAIPRPPPVKVETTMSASELAALIARAAGASAEAPLCAEQNLSAALKLRAAAELALRRAAAGGWSLADLRDSEELARSVGAAIACLRTEDQTQGAP